MKPGPELDALVHENVLNLCHHDWKPDQWPTPSGGLHYASKCAKCEAWSHLTVWLNTPNYSRDMGMAWLVVEKLRLGGSLVSIAPEPDGMWVVSCTKALNPKGDGTADGFDDTYPDTTVKVASPAHGVCLLAVDYLLDEATLNEYLVDCMFCGETRAKGHTKDCPAHDMGPELQKAFQRHEP